jgi:hypothetical protein
MGARIIVIMKARIGLGKPEVNMRYANDLFNDK